MEATTASNANRRPTQFPRLSILDKITLSQSFTSNSKHIPRTSIKNNTTTRKSQKSTRKPKKKNAKAATLTSLAGTVDEDIGASDKLVVARQDRQGRHPRERELDYFIW